MKRKPESGDFRTILRGAARTPPISDKEIVEKAAVERAAIRAARQALKPSGGSKKGKRSD